MLLDVCNGLPEHPTVGGWMTNHKTTFNEERHKVGENKDGTPPR